jgi:hypothetical protein
MTELLFLILHFFLIFFIFNLNIYKIKYNNDNYSFAENNSLNIIFFLNILLILSFFNLKLNLIIYLSIFYFLFIILKNIIQKKKIFNFVKKNLIYIIIFSISSLVLCLELANDLVIGWDAQKFWIYKSISFYNNNSIDKLNDLPNSFYPYLGSLVWSFFWKISFLKLEYFGRIFYVYLYLSSILLIITNIKVSTFYKTILYFFLIIISYNNSYNNNWSIFSGYQEIIIFALVTIACHYLLKILNNDNKKIKFNLLIVLLICNLLIWTKHEGFIISSSIISSLLFFSTINKKNKILISLIFLFIIFVRMFIFEIYEFHQSGQHNLPHSAFTTFTLNNIQEYFSLFRLLTFFKYLLIYFFSNYLILIGLIIIFFYFLDKRSVKINFFLFLILFNLFFITVVYLLMDLELNFIEDGLKTTLDRIVFQLSPFVFIIMINFINNIKKKLIF